MESSNNNHPHRHGTQRWLHHKDKIKQKPLTPQENINYSIGLILFIGIFILLIPYILYKLNLITLLLVYFLNIDLVATILGSIEGPLHNYFRYLYSDSTPFIGYISQTLISLVVLGAVFLIVVGRTKKSSLGVALIRYLFTILITFLAPNRFMSQMMHSSYVYLKNSKFSQYFPEYLSTIPALILTYVVIIFEAHCLENYSESLGKYLDKKISKLHFIDELEKYRK